MKKITRINIKEVLRFFDDREASAGHATAIVGIVGEDFCASAFADYLKAKGNEVKVIDGSVTPGTRKGKRLDRWIYVKDKNDKETLYQCEIKNWSATAIGGYTLAPDADNERIRKVSQSRWKQQEKVFSKTTKPDSVTKVLLRMKPECNVEVKRYLKDRKIKNQKPLLIYWMPISPYRELQPFFTKKVSGLVPAGFKTDFRDIHIFSVSLYLRRLKGKSLPLHERANISKRMDVLDKILMR